jgi:hypothetical protein
MQSRLPKWQCLNENCLHNSRGGSLSVADVAAKQGLSEVSFAVYELLEREANDRTEPPADGEQHAPAAPNRDLDQQLKVMAQNIEQLCRSHYPYLWRAGRSPPTFAAVLLKADRRSVKRSSSHHATIGITREPSDSFVPSCADSDGERTSASPFSAMVSLAPY